MDGAGARTADVRPLPTAGFIAGRPQRLALLTGCATTLTARSDYDRSKDFSGLRSYAWITDDPIVTAPGEASPVSPLNRRRIVEAVDAALLRKGYTRAVEPDAADFVVSYTVGARGRGTWATRRITERDIAEADARIRGPGYVRTHFGPRTNRATWRWLPHSSRRRAVRLRIAV